MLKAAFDTGLGALPSSADGRRMAHIILIMHSLMDCKSKFLACGVVQDDPRFQLADPICTFLFALLVLWTTRLILQVRLGCSRFTRA